MKTIIATFLVTLTATVMVAYLFMNTLLGAFGMVAISMESLTELKASHSIVKRMQERHLSNKLKISKGFIKRSAKKVATTTLAAATLGSAAVAITMAGIEIENYCDQKKEMSDEYNLLFGTETSFDFAQCRSEGKEDITRIIAEANNDAQIKLKGALDIAADKLSEIKNKTNDILFTYSKYLSELRASALDTILE